MKRDMDLIRKIAFQLEEFEHSKAIQLKIEGYQREQILYNAMLMEDAGLIVVTDAQKVAGRYVIVPETTRLSWAGHDFLDAARNETVWNSVTKHAKDSAVSLTFDALKGLLKQAGQQVFRHGVDWLSKNDWFQYLPMQ